jgi:excinuclease UvrABC ATPase subunit
LSELSINDTIDFFENISLNKEEQQTVKNVIKNASERLEFLT